MYIERYSLKLLFSLWLRYVLPLKKLYFAKADTLWDQYYIIYINYFAVPVRSTNDENTRWDIGDMQVEADTGISVPHLEYTNREEPGVSQQTSDTQTTSPGSNINQQTHLFQTASANNENLEKSEPVQESTPANSRFNKLQNMLI